jgi:hypothetical protein
MNAMIADIKIAEVPPYFSPESLAKYLDLKGGESTIRKLRRQGRLPPPDLLIGNRRLPRWSYAAVKTIVGRGEI